MNTIYDIYEDILLDIPIIDILTKYDDFNIKMINFIKSKDKLYFELLNNYINNELRKNISKIIIKQSLINKITNIQLLNFIIDNHKLLIIDIFIDNLKIVLDKNEIYQPLKPLILNQSQNQVLNYYQANSVKSGLIIHATGSGKTNCIYLTMGFNEPNIIFILCTYKTILQQLLYNITDKQYNLDYEKFRQLKYANILNIWNYDIYNLANDNLDRKEIIKQLPNINKLPNKKIFLINPQFITLKNRYKLLPIPNLIIHDECHCITATGTLKFLSYFVKYPIPIIGLSATPIRYIKKSDNYDKIQNIYTSNIISNYENIKAIINGDILNIEFYWFDAKLDNKKSKSNIDNLINKILQIYDRLPNKKILIWCGTISHTEFIFEIFNNHPILKTLFNNILIDHSQISEPETNSYFTFKTSKEKSILICAEKYREGNDIEYLDTIIFADLVQNKSDVPFIQSIGRVQRIGYNKTIGYVIDHYEKSKEKPKSEFVINKLIKYYYELFFHSSKKNYNEKINIALNEYEQIFKNISFNYSENDSVINIKIIDDLYIKIHLNIAQDDFDDIEFKFDSKIKEHITKEHNLFQNEILKLEYETFKICNQVYKIKTKSEYYSRINEFNYIDEPEIKYKDIWKNWYDYLGIDTSIFLKKDEWIKKYKQLKVDNYNDYLYKVSSQNIKDMPLMPEEIYNIKNIILEFLKNDVLIL
jgi:superfamily II DNA or RNA helicase